MLYYWNPVQLLNSLMDQPVCQHSILAHFYRLKNAAAAFWLEAPPPFLQSQRVSICSSGHTLPPYNHGRCSERRMNTAWMLLIGAPLAGMIFVLWPAVLMAALSDLRMKELQGRPPVGEADPTDHPPTD
jgi:hypothetical protein